MAFIAEGEKPRRASDIRKIQDIMNYEIECLMINGFTTLMN